MQRVHQRFSPQGEGGLHRPPQGGLGHHVHRRRLPHGTVDHGGGHLGGGQEAGGRDGEQQLRVGVVLHQYSERAVLRRAGPGADALRHLFLYQDGETVEAAALHAFGQDGGGDVIGQIGAEDGPQSGEMLLYHLREVQLHGVALDEGEVVRAGHGLPQHGVETGVQLHRRHLGGAAHQLSRQRADAGANLQHAGALVRTAGVGDIPGHPALDEKILAHGLGKMKAVALQKRLYLPAVAKIHCCLSL